MAHRADAPTIPLDQIQWEDNSEEPDTGRVLLANIKIGPLDMHLEAWEIDTSQELQTTFERADEHNTLCNMMDCCFETIEINGRRYFLVATPYGS